jgi:hypothetical protein
MQDTPHREGGERPALESGLSPGTVAERCSPRVTITERTTIGESHERYQGAIAALPVSTLADSASTSVVPRVARAEQTAPARASRRVNSARRTR